MDIFPLITETMQYAYGAEMFRATFDWHNATFTGPDDQPEEGQHNSMTMDHINATVDLLLGADDLEGAVQVIRQGQRWLQSRTLETHWNQFDDDREYDPPGHVREEEDMEDFEGFPLDVTLRHRLALARLRLGQDSEALVSSSEDLFVERLIVDVIHRSMSKKSRRWMFRSITQCS